jgi:hypothetical protein
VLLGPLHRDLESGSPRRRFRLEQVDRVDVEDGGEVVDQPEARLPLPVLQQRQVRRRLAHPLAEVGQRHPPGLAEVTQPQPEEAQVDLGVRHLDSPGM